MLPMYAPPEWLIVTLQIVDKLLRVLSLIVLYWLPAVLANLMGCAIIALFINLAGGKEIFPELILWLIFAGFVFGLGCRIFLWRRWVLTNPDEDWQSDFTSQLWLMGMEVLIGFALSLPLLTSDPVWTIGLLVAELGLLTYSWWRRQLPYHFAW